MANLPRWENCWSSYNLTSFLAWFHSHASPAEQQEALGLYIMVHRSGPSPMLRELGIVPREVPCTVQLHDGTQVALPRRECPGFDCARCSAGRGGYMFRWIDSRWTPSAALALHLNPQEVAVEMYKPWPRGMRSMRPQAPTPEIPQDAPSSTAPAGPADGSSQPAGSEGRKKKKSNRRAAAAAAASSPAAPTASTCSGASSSYSGPAEAPQPPHGREAWHLMAIPEPSSTPEAFQLEDR